MTSSNLQYVQESALIVAPILPGLLSCFANGTINAMILHSPAKLSKPFYRIIFGMCVYDVLQSLSAPASSAPMPSGTKWGDISNEGTCIVQGFLLQVSICVGDTVNGADTSKRVLTKDDGSKIQINIRDCTTEIEGHKEREKFGW